MIYVGHISFMTCYPTYVLYLICRQCIFIPDEIKEECSRLKSTGKGIVTGRKQYWVESAAKKGLCNGEKGIVFVSV